MKNVSNFILKKRENKIKRIQCILPLCRCNVMYTAKKGIENVCTVSEKMEKERKEGIIRQTKVT